MIRNITLLFIISLSFFPAISGGQNKQEANNPTQQSFVYKKLATPNPSVEAEALYRYLQNLFGEKILSAQMYTSWGIDEIKYIQSVTGKKPALKGIDLIHDSNNKSEIQDAINWWKAGGIPAILWQWRTSPISRKSLIKKEIEIEKCFVKGTSENKTMMSEFKKKADHLEILRDNNVPVLWCPFYELYENQLWMSKKGPASFKKLWQTMFNYFVHERKLNNLIWIFGYEGDPDAEWFPGHKFVDIIGAEIYEGKNDPQVRVFNKMSDITGDIRTPIAYNICGSIPDPAECEKTGAMWSWCMLWHTTHLTETDMVDLKKFYSHYKVITLEEVPNIVQEYRNEYIVKRDFNTVRTIPFSELKHYNIGLKQTSGTFTIKNDKIEIVAGGADIGGKKDEGSFVFKQIDGDFDLSVQVHSLFAAHTYTKAGIMARVDLSKNSKHVFFHVFPDNSPRDKNKGGCEFQYRPEKAKETKAIYPDLKTEENKFHVNFPNTWIRLTRRGNIFKSYISNDNVNWNFHAKHEQKMPKKLLLGLAVTSHDPNENTKAEFSSLFITGKINSILQPYNFKYKKTVSSN